MKLVKKLWLELHYLYLSLRTRWHMRFQPNYIKESLKKRKGKCLNCGMCCHSPFRKCKYFNNQCLIHDSLPDKCIIYPYDKKSKGPLSVQTCGYYW